jgi:hypothetical protein
MKKIVATAGQIAGSQRKLGWFQLLPNGLYFDFAGLFFGTHTSYHKDGNIFRTSLTADSKPILQGKHLKISDFHGWYQLGIAMISKERVSNNPIVKNKDKRKAEIFEVDLDYFPENTYNVIAELISEDFYPYLNNDEVSKPVDAVEIRIPFGRLSGILTFLGHDHNLIVRADEKNLRVSHFNSRFSANQKGVDYTFEAYGF